MFGYCAFIFVYNCLVENLGEVENLEENFPPKGPKNTASASHAATYSSEQSSQTVSCAYLTTSLISIPFTRGLQC